MAFTLRSLVDMIINTNQSNHASHIASIAENNREKEEARKTAELESL